MGFLVNGRVVGRVVPFRRLRQGCPLSPYLSILYAKALSGLFSISEKGGRVLGARCCRGSPLVSHLFFADDSILFCRASVESCEEIKRIFEVYGKGSSQVVNLQKSSLTFSPNVVQEVRREVQPLLELKDIQTHDKYLGLPSLVGRNKRRMCMVLWGIWFNRNAGVHSGVVRSAEVLLSWISGLLVEFKDTHRALAASKGAPTTAATVWSCPPPGMLKLNTDVAVKPGNDCVGVGAVIRDSSRLVVAAVSKTLLGCFSAETSEMLALREGLLLARNLGLNVQLIEVDACNVVSSVLGSDSCCGENGLIVLDIKALLKVVRFVKCQAISRKSNGVAHNLASLALSSLKERYWHNVCLSCIFPCL
ncbi:hypothetical protein ACOSQ4_023048 [Xanthoceras sorbifolium]